jgi:hypothetical protein
MRKEKWTRRTPKVSEVRYREAEGVGQVSGYGDQQQKVEREREGVPLSSNYSVTG